MIYPCYVFHVPPHLIIFSQARDDVPFLFKAFEVGQARPPPVKYDGFGTVRPRAATIHEFLDWTVSGVVPIEARRAVRYTQDFWGFRMIMIYARHRPQYPPPRTYDVEVPCPEPRLAAPMPPMPILLPKGKPLTAATIRAGHNYLEVPFFATVDHRRGQGFGRILLEVIEDVARAIGVNLIMLCSENHQNTWGVWEHLGFKKTTRCVFIDYSTRLFDTIFPLHHHHHHHHHHHLLFFFLPFPFLRSLCLLVHLQSGVRNVRYSEGGVTAHG